MILEKAVYDIKQKIVGYTIFEQDVNDETDSEIFIGFRRC